ncbi:guanitoxin biosynthesis L-enduracididine beta-hydroxylase GntD [Streptomyces sp. NPDC048416]|uniref:guanitoxin biosynthesis L-enduracididine beta-hydroxylase GntD n=1 Tax=Streptomyces sp. NPDC048416 TaxID=3365546 RepID=UPI0037125FD1
MSSPTHVLTYRLSEPEICQLDSLLTALAQGDHDPAAPGFHDGLWRFVAELPVGLREFLADFRTHETAAACKVTGLPVDDEAVGPTPLHWTEAAKSDAARREEFFLSLLTGCVGEVFGWPTLQEGRLIQNVLPMPGEETQQSGHSSDVLLAWHTEDGFHPYRCDYLGLFGVRNQDQVPTTLASVADIDLDGRSRRILHERRFTTLPDDEHLRQLRLTAPDSPALLRLQRMRDEPEPVAVLFGDESDPYLRIDPYFMPQLNDDDETARALRRLTAELDRVQSDVVVEAGSLLFVDNYRAVHGRRAFASRYDGTDRWLKKTVSTRDLRKSRDMRGHSAGRHLT